MKKELRRILSLLLSLWMLLSPCLETYAADPASFAVPAGNESVQDTATASASEVGEVSIRKTTPSEPSKTGAQKSLSVRVGSTRIVMTFDPDAFEEIDGLRLSATEIKNEANVEQYVETIENDEEVEKQVRETFTEAGEDEEPLVNDIVLYDIKVLNAAGEELQPLKEVKVSFENIDELTEPAEEDAASLQVCHFEDKETVEVLEAESPKDGCVQVETEHFSVYAVTSMGMGYHLAPVKDPDWTPDTSEPEVYRLTSDGEGSLTRISDYDFRVTESANLKASPPTKYSTVTSYGLPEARNQGQEGLCWSFAAICLAEAYQRRMDKEDLSVDYSEMALAYFTTHHPVDPLGLTSGDGMIVNPNSGEPFNKIGANCFIATETLSGWVGVTEESDAPYSDLEPDESVAYQDSVILKDSYFFDDTDVASIKKHIQQYGAVSVGYYHNDSYMHENVTTGGFYYYYNGGTTANHNVTIVGWDDSVKPANFSEYSYDRPSSSGAWLVRNSWGDDWGDDGYFWISYEDTSLTCFNGMVFEDPDTWEYNYHYDGSAYPSTYESSDYSVGNIFRATSSGQVLDAVSLATYSPGAEYTLKIYRKSSQMTSPVNGTLTYSASGVMTYAGLNTVSLSTPIDLNNGEYFSVVFELSDSVEVGVSVNSSNYNASYWSVDETESNQSYIKRGSTWDDLSSQDVTVRIHAYTGIERHTISYVMNGGTNDSRNPKKTRTTAIAASDLYDPKRTGYTFKGWYLDSGFTLPFVEIPANADRDYTLYAKWTVNKYYIAYNANGGSGSMDKTTATYGVATALKACTFTQSGYVFDGWNTKADGSGINYADKQSVRSLTSTNGKTITLYAQWERLTYTITYNLNGGRNNSSNPSTYTAASATITLASPTRTGYTFVGWYSNSAMTMAVKTIKNGSTGNKTFYAKWTANKYNIQFNANGGKGTMATMKNVAYGTSVTLTKNKYTKTGYSFAGWNTKKDGSGTKYANAASVKNLSTKNGATITLYAQWGYKITYKLNGGTNSASNPTSLAAGSKFTLLSPTRTGYRFGGWYTNSAMTSKYKITQLNSTTFKKDITLYAKWTVNTYKIVFKANGGTGSMSVMSMTYGQKKALTANKFKRAECSFSGWNTKADGSGKAYANGVTVSNLTSTNGATVTLYAQWKSTFSATATINSSKKIDYTANQLTYTISGSCTGVEVWRKTGSSGSWVLLKKTTGKTSYTDNTAEAGVQYYYRLRPYKILSGNAVTSTYSNIRGITTACEPEFSADISKKEKTYLRLRVINHGSKVLKVGGSNGRTNGAFYPNGAEEPSVRNYLTDADLDAVDTTEIADGEIAYVYFKFDVNQVYYLQDLCYQEFYFEYDGCRYIGTVSYYGTVSVRSES